MKTFNSILRDMAESLSCLRRTPFHQHVLECEDSEFDEYKQAYLKAIGHLGLFLNIHRLQELEMEQTDLVENLQTTQEKIRKAKEFIANNKENN